MISVWEQEHLMAMLVSAKQEQAALTPPTAPHGFIYLF